MDITFLNQSNENSWKNYKSYLGEIANKVKETLELKTEFAFSVIMVNDNEIQEINRRYRNIDRPTDVISFAMQEGEDIIDEHQPELMLGDIFINVDAVRRQAADYGHSLKREFCFLTVHGLLHLLGYDHMNPTDDTAMITLQERVLYDIARR